MTGNVALLLAPIYRDGIDHVTSAPRWAPPSDGEGYWHVPRSVSTEELGYVRVLFWCGAERSMKYSRLTNREPKENRCGTCIGRVAGYERTDGMIFSPRSHFDPPRFCPAYCGDAERCYLCGAKVRWTGGALRGWSERNHRPGDGLAAYSPCDRHGWKNLGAETERYADRNGCLAYRETGRIICRERECGYVLLDAVGAYQAAWIAAACHNEQRREWARFLSKSRRRATSEEGRNG